MIVTVIVGIAPGSHTMRGIAMGTRPHSFRHNTKSNRRSRRRGRNRRDQRDSSAAHARILHLELLEPRCVLTTFVVNDLLDAPNNDAALTNLREAIELANENAGPDIIEFDASIRGQAIPMTHGQFAIRDDLAVKGPGADSLTIDGAGNSRIFHIAADATVELRGMTLDRGTVREQHGGSIFNRGTLILDDVTVSNGFVIQTTQPNRFGGAGIYNDAGAELTLANSAVVNSVSQGDAGGILNRGTLTLRDGSRVTGNHADFTTGGIHSSTGSLTLIDSVVDNNVGMYEDGGGIRFEGSSLTLVRSHVRNNSAVNNGGGIWVGAASNASISNSLIYGNDAVWGAGIYATAGLAIQRSALYDNFANFGGGALYVDATADVTIDNTTVSSNRSNGRAGGIWNSGSLLVLNSTIASNSADDDGFEGADTGGGISNSGNAVVHNSIIVGNTETASRFFGSDVTGSALDPESSHNMIGLRGRGGLQDGVNGNIVTEDHGLEVDLETQLPRLKNNGGPSPTHLLLPDSPAIDAGSDQFDPFLDQRQRPITDVSDVGTSNVDMGSYELQQFARSDWKSEVNDASQFGPGEAFVHGFGFDDGKRDSSVQKRPEFIGFQFDTGPLTLGEVLDGPFDSKWGGELRADFAGRFGINLGFYINSGSVDVNYDGTLNYVIDDPGNNQPIRIDTVLDVDNGSLYTISPKVGAYADLVMELNARIGATGCVWDCIGGDTSFKLDERFELFSINRQELDRDDIDGDGNLREPLFYDANGEETTNSQGTVTPIFDGDIRLAFDQLIKEAIEDTKEGIRDSRAARQLQKADEEERRGRIDAEEGQRDLDKASNDQERAKAEQKIADGQSKVSSAEDRRARTVEKMADRELGGTPKAGLSVSFGEAEGSLLGVQATLSAGIGVDGVASAEKELGTMAITLPDVNLRHVGPDRHGALSASTQQFPEGSDLDARRQLARISLDVGGMLGPLVGLPTGKYSADIGPLSVEVQTVSYNIIPKLDVIQNVHVTPYAKQYGFEFDREVVVEVNDEVMGPVTSVQFDPADTIQVHANGQPVTITPTLSLGNRFTNQIGLEVDIDGALEAFRLGLSVAGEEIVGLGPLITHQHRFGTLPLGNVFDQTFDLTATDLAEGHVLSQSLSPFTIGLPMTGGSPGTPIAVDGSVVVNVDSTEPLFVSTRLLDRISESNRATFYQDVTYDVSDNLVSSIVVFHEGLRLTLADGEQISLQEAVRYDLAEPTSSVRLSGYNPLALGESTNALVGLMFTENGPVQLTPIRENSVGISVELTAVDAENMGGIDDLVASMLRPTVSLSADIDADGVASPLTDGVLLIRYLRGRRDDSLVSGAVNPDGDRTSSDDVIRYIEDVMLQSTTDESTGQQRQPLDIDGDGEISDSTDAILLTRYMAGFTGDSLITNAIGPQAIRRTANEILDYLDHGIVTANNQAVVLRDEFDQAREVVGLGLQTDRIVDRRDRDRFGVDGRQDADPDATVGSSAAAAKTQLVTGAAPVAAKKFDRADPLAAKKAYEYVLSTAGKTVSYNAYYLDRVDSENLISRVADGAPMDFSGHPELISLLANLDETAVDDLNSRILARQDDVVLGIDAPIFIQAHDAAGYTYRALDGHRFKTIEFDADYGGNVYLDPEFDLYLHDDQRNEWVYEATISSSSAYAFSDDGVDQFQLFGLALRNESLHRSGNQAAPGTRAISDGTLVYELPTTIGFTFKEAASFPTIQLVEEAPRESLSTPDTIDDPKCLINCSQANNEDALFHVVRHGANVETTTLRYIANQPLESLVVVDQQMDPVNSSTGLFFEGDSFVDIVMLDGAGGPIRLPVRFDAGEGQDRLTVDGAGVRLDLVARDSITGVEEMDLRGDGANSLNVDAQAVLGNAGTGNVLIVQADTDDVVSVDEGWVGAGTENINGTPFNVYANGSATLKVSAAANLTVVNAAVGTEPVGRPVPRRVDREPIIPVVASKKDSPQDRDDPPTGELPDVAQRVIRSSEANPLIRGPNEAFVIGVLYETEPDTTTTGLHVRIHYDSSRLRLDDVTDVYTPGFSVQEVSVDGPCFGDDSQTCYGLDGDPATDAYVHLLWIDPNGEWHASEEPLPLLNLHLTTSDSFRGETTVNFTGSLAAGLAFDSNPVTIRENQQPGDFDHDGSVGASDIQLLCDALHATNPNLEIDLNGDGAVDETDRDHLIGQILGTSYGDADLDGVFNSSDLVQVLQKAEYEDDLTGNSNWESGDWDCDGEFDSSDLILALSFGGYSSESVPLHAVSGAAAQAVRDNVTAPWIPNASKSVRDGDLPQETDSATRMVRQIPQDRVFASGPSIQWESVDAVMISPTFIADELLERIT